MFEILYTSTAVVRFTPEEMDRFLGPSRQRNADAGITGFLLSLHDPGGGPGFFIQALEGPQAAVEETYARIKRDRRHCDATTIHRRHTEGRAFRDWSMRLESITTDQALAAVGRFGDPFDAATPLWELLVQGEFTRRLVTAFRTVTAGVHSAR